MADDEQDKATPSLEPPSLFKRKKKPKAAPAEPADERPSPPPPPPTRPPPPPPPRDPEPATILDIDPPAAQPATQPLPPAPPPAAPVFGDEGPTDDPMTARSPLAPPPPFSEAELEPEQPAKSRGPWLPGPVAAAIVGLVVGGFIVGATTAAFQICIEVSGTESCGNPGFLLLVAILIVAVALGGALLRLCGVREPGSTSFLAVGLLSVVAMLFFIDQLLDWWMLIAIPLISVLTFLGSQWVTASFTDAGQTETPPVGDDWFHQIR